MGMPRGYGNTQKKKQNTPNESNMGSPGTRGHPRGPQNIPTQNMGSPGTWGHPGNTGMPQGTWGHPKKPRTPQPRTTWDHQGHGDTQKTPKDPKSGQYRITRDTGPPRGHPRALPLPSQSVPLAGKIWGRRGGGGSPSFLGCPPAFWGAHLSPGGAGAAPGPAASAPSAGRSPNPRRCSRRYRAAPGSLAGTSATGGSRNPDGSGQRPLGGGKR